MKARIISGKPVAQAILKRIKARAAAVRRRRGRPVSLAIVCVGKSPAGTTYLRSKVSACGKAGIRTSIFILPSRTGEAAVVRRIKEIAADRAIDAVIVERPLPGKISLAAVFAALPPRKDAEGVTVENFGRMMVEPSYQGIMKHKLIVPCAALASIILLLESRTPIAGKTAVVVGRSNILGRPAAHLLTTLNATVTLAHSKTKDLKGLLKRADIVVAAVGRPRYIKGSWLKRGAAVVDAGINWDERGLCGDVDESSALKRAGKLTPVPGGVGPVTTALLLSNAVRCAERR